MFQPNKSVSITIPYSGETRNQEQIYCIADDLWQAGVPVFLQERRYPLPIAAGYVELVIGLAMGVTLTHYVDKILDLLDASVAKEFSEISLQLSKGQRATQAILKRQRDRDFAELMRALNELEKKGDSHEI